MKRENGKRLEPVPPVPALRIILPVIVNNIDRKEAIERIKTRFDKWALDNEDMKAIQTLIPELAESEDEKHKEWILEYLHDGLHKADEQFKDQFKAAIAWLEKQKECSFCNFPKSCDDCPKEIQAVIDKKFGINGRDDNDNPLNGYGDWKKGMVLNGPAIWGLVKLGIELQKEQKHPDGCFSCDEYKKGYEAGRLNGFTAGYNKATKEQQPAEWSEEEHKLLNYAISLTDDAEVKTFLESLRNQPKQEWGEKDEKQYESVLNGLKYAHADLVRVGSMESAEIVSSAYTWFENRLKSLRPQSKQEWNEEDDEVRTNRIYLKRYNDAVRNFSWKPTEEQMKDLFIASREGCDAGSPVAENLKSIYDALQKL